VQPIERLLAIKLNGSRNCQWIVRTDFLDEFTIPGCPGISDYDEVEWPLLRPMALQSDFNWHLK
jgi:diphthamide synthase subunit DPH2